jgi:hypothetical protein
MLILYNCIALNKASVIFLASNLTIMFFLCVLTVSKLIDSKFEISFVLNPFAINFNISLSRIVKSFSIYSDSTLSKQQLRLQTHFQFDQAASQRNLNRKSFILIYRCQKFANIPGCQIFIWQKKC